MTAALGKHLAKPSIWGLDETKEGKPYVFIGFQLPEGSYYWKGYLNEGFARENTIKTLVTCGFRDDELAWLSEPDALDKNTDVLITIEEEMYDGKPRVKVTWINPARKVLSKEESIKLTKGLDLKALFRGEFGARKVTKRTRTAPKPATIGDNDIPF